MTRPSPSDKRLKWIGCAGLVLCSVMVSIGISGVFQPLVVLILCVSVFSFSKSISPLPEARALIWCGLFSILFGMAVSVGSTVHVIGMRAPMTENRLSLSFPVLLAGLATGILLFPIVLQLRQFTVSCQGGLSEGTTAAPSRFKLIAWGLILLGWLPYLLTFYPGGIVGDGACSLEDALVSGPINSNRWMAFVVFLQRICIRFAYLFTGENIRGLQLGVFLYVLAATAFVSYGLASVCDALVRHHYPMWYSWSAVGFFALCGFFASHAMSLWKDAPFSAGIVLLCIELWDMICPQEKENDRETKKSNVIRLIRFTLLFLFLCFFRPNGIVIVLLTLVLLLLLLKRRILQVFLCGVCAAVFFFLVTGPVYNALGIRNYYATESISIPVQQMAAVINGGGKITEEQKERLYGIIPEETWKLYSPTLSDDLKNNLDPETFKVHFPAFLQTWAELLIPNLGIYIKAYLMQTLGFWQPFVRNGNGIDYWFGIQDLAGRGYHQVNLLEKATGLELTASLQERAGFLSSGTVIWIFMLAMVLILSKKGNRRERLAPMMPLFTCWLVLMVSVPIAYSYRYIEMLPMALPLILVFPIDRKRG